MREGGTGVSPVDSGVPPESVEALGNWKDCGMKKKSKFAPAVLLVALKNTRARTELGETPNSTGGTPVPPEDKLRLL